MRFESEASHGANAGLNLARDLMEKVKKEFDWISYGDLWTLAGVAAVQVGAISPLNFAGRILTDGVHRKWLAPRFPGARVVLTDFLLMLHPTVVSPTLLRVLTISGMSVFVYMFSLGVLSDSDFSRSSAAWGTPCLLHALLW